MDANFNIQGGSDHLRDQMGLLAISLRGGGIHLYLIVIILTREAESGLIGLIGLIVEYLA